MQWSGLPGREGRACRGSRTPEHYPGSTTEAGTAAMVARAHVLLLLLLLLLLHLPLQPPPPLLLHPLLLHPLLLLLSVLLAAWPRSQAVRRRGDGRAAGPECSRASGGKEGRECNREGGGSSRTGETTGNKAGETGKKTLVVLQT